MRTLRMLERFYRWISMNMIQYEHLHPVVASPLPEASSTKKLAADGPLGHHLDALA